MTGYEPSLETAKIAPVGSINSSLDTIQGNIDQLLGALDALQAKLDPVLCSVPQGEGCSVGRPLSATQIAARIDALNDRVLIAITQANSLIDRVDI